MSNSTTHFTRREKFDIVRMREEQRINRPAVGWFEDESTENELDFENGSETGLLLDNNQQDNPNMEECFFKFYMMKNTSAILVSDCEYALVSNQSHERAEEILAPIRSMFSDLRFDEICEDVYSISRDDEYLTNEELQELTEVLLAERTDYHELAESFIH